MCRNAIVEFGKFIGVYNLSRCSLKFDKVLSHGLFMKMLDYMCDKFGEYDDYKPEIYTKTDKWVVYHFRHKKNTRKRTGIIFTTLKDMEDFIGDFKLIIGNDILSLFDDLLFEKYSSEIIRSRLKLIDSNNQIDFRYSPDSRQLIFIDSEHQNDKNHKD